MVRRFPLPVAAGFFGRLDGSSGRFPPRPPEAPSDLARFDSALAHHFKHTSTNGADDDDDNENERAMTTDDREVLEGIVVSMRVFKAEDFWGRATIELASGETVAMTGKLFGVKTGVAVKAHGCWSDHPRFGRQWKASRIDVELPSTDSGVIKWLAELPNIGPGRARALVERFGANGVFTELDAGGTKLTEVRGITAKRLEGIVDAYREAKADSAMRIQLFSWGLTPGQTARAVAQWGDDTVERIRANPYELIDSVWGFGFRRADEIALRMGLERSSPARLRAGIAHTMSEAAADGGHTYVTGGSLVRIAAALLGVLESDVKREVLVMKNAGRLVGFEAKSRKDPTRSVWRFSLPDLFDAEKQIAAVFTEALKTTSEAA